MIISIVLILFYSILIDTTHFNGGSITWSPLNPSDNSSSVMISITQFYSWVYPSVLCDFNVPISTPARVNQTSILKCVSGCSTQGGYSTSPVSILTDCTSLSSPLHRMTSQRSVNITLAAGAHFSISFRGGTWIALNNPLVIGLDWSLLCSIDLRMRDDGIINTPPTANVASPQYLIVNTTTQIRLIVNDVNIGDDIRCRWSHNQSSVDECADVCYPGGLPNDTILSNCTLSFRGTVSGIWYALAIQVEDFINSSSNVSMSSVPIQLLIYILPVPKCPELPIFLPPTNCLEVEVGISINLTLYAMSLCNVTTSTIVEIMKTVSIDEMKISNITNSTTNASLVYITLSWTPQISQVGSQQFCAVAYTSEKVQSEEYCVLFNVTTSNSLCITPTASQSPTTTSASNKINIPLIVSMSLLALLLSLCCGWCWLYHLLWGAAARRSRRNKTGKEVRQGRYLSFDWQDSYQEHRIRKSNNYLMDNKSSDQNKVDSLRSSNLTERVPISSIDDNKVDSIRLLGRRKTAKLSEEIQLYNNQIIDKYKSMAENISKPTHSDVTVSRLNKISKTDENNQKHRYTVDLSHQEKFKDKSGLINDINLIKLQKGKIALSHHISINHLTNSNNNHIDKLQEKNKISSDPKARIIRLKLNNVDKKRISNVDRSHSQDDNIGRKRTSSFGTITVIKLKRNTHK